MKLSRGTIGWTAFASLVTVGYLLYGFAVAGQWPCWR